MAANTSKPPYVFPRQRPTRESCNLFENVLVRVMNGFREGYQWQYYVTLADGDVWVPGCDKFFRDWADRPLSKDSQSGRRYADEHWLSTSKGKSKPPYVYPQQKPTDESFDYDGDILKRVDDDGVRRYSWVRAGCLWDGDVWVPGCQAFFDDWANSPIHRDAWARQSYANENWLKAAGEADE